nr:MAG TPA: High-potential iron-sulfur protein-sulfur protein, METAL BINDING PROTEIN [Caudoviricetes sp.]
MNNRQVCSECKLFAYEDSFGNGWCEFHQKEAFCENVACEDGIEIIEGSSSLDMNINSNL